MIRRLSLFALVAVAASAACNSRMPAAHGRLRSEAALPDAVLAGAALVDITPPPGASMFGHGPAAGVAFGYWTRLQCRAFYFEPAQKAEDGFSIVACDLPNISTVLHRRVAERLCPPLPAARLMLTATHTHAGPGHYTESENFSGKGSALFPGFDPAMVDFLSERIAGAIETARRGARPARLRWLGDELWGLTRNRSLVAYQNNRPPAAWPPPASMSGQGEAWRAVDPVLRVLQIQSLDDDDLQHGAIGSLSFFAMHPTVVGNSNRYWGGDAFGVATRRVEARMGSRPAPSERSSCAAGCDRARLAVPSSHGGVHALINTNEGDISPDWRLNSPAEAIRIGQRIGDSIASLLRSDERAPTAASPHSRVSAWRSEPRLGIRYLEERLPGAPFFLHASGETRHLCEEPELGIGSVRGAEDHPSVFQAIFSVEKPNADPKRVHCQAPKRPFLGVIQGVSSGRWAFPEQVPLGLVRIDDTWVSFMPAELTITAGHRVNEAVLEVARKQVERPDAVVAGLANGYLLYVATPEEFQLQHYEGASTLYGPNTAPLLAERAWYLASHLACPAMESGPTRGANAARVDQAQAFEYKTGPERERLWRAEQDVPLERLVGEREVEGTCTLPNTDPPGICMWWVDGGPAAVHLDQSPWIELVGCDRKAARAGTPCEPVPMGMDDRGILFHTRLHDPVEEAWRWATVFRPGRAEWDSLQGRVSLRLRARGNELAGPIDSLPFDTRELPPVCTASQLRDVCAAPW